MKIRVKVLEGFSGLVGSFRKGAEATLDEKEARSLRNANLVEFISDEVENREKPIAERIIVIKDEKESTKTEATKTKRKYVARKKKTATPKTAK